MQLHARTVLGAVLLLLPAALAAPAPDTRTGTAPLAPRIVGGTTVTNPQAYPFAAAILRNREVICGGTVLNEWKILTAAHCLANANAKGTDLQVRVGSLTYTHGGSLVDVRDTDKHLSNDKKTFDYDIAVLILDRSLKFSTTLKAATIVPSGDPAVVGRPVTAVGWGQTSQYDTARSPTLLEATLMIQKHDECRETWTENYMTFTDRMLCAVAPGKDACTYDSGGPLVQPDGVVRGSVSWSLGCDLGFPGVYVDYGNKEISAWIEEHKDYGSKIPPAPGEEEGGQGKQT